MDLMSPGNRVDTDAVKLFCGPMATREEHHKGLGSKWVEFEVLVFVSPFMLSVHVCFFWKVLTGVGSLASFGFRSLC